MPKPLLMVFAKNPVKGSVKTRLAKSVGDDKALEVYNLLLAHTLNVSKAVSHEKILYLSDSITDSVPVSGETFTLALQQGHDLGEKMCNTFQQAFMNGYGPVVIIGTDCYELNAAVLNEAFDLLKQYNVVIGPAADGGYYLLGMQQLVAELFTNKHWSTDTVLADTLRDVTQHNISFTLLRTLSDIDTVEDLAQSRLRY